MGWSDVRVAEQNKSALYLVLKEELLVWNIL